MSFYSRDVYRDAASAWKGIGLSYLLVLLALCWLPSSARWFFALRGFAETHAQAIVAQLPAITIENGVMRARPSGRHVLHDPSEKESKETEIIIDDSIDYVPSDIHLDTVILTRREIGMVRPSRRERRVWTLTPAADMDVTPDEVRAFLRSLQFWVPAVGYVVSVTGSLVFRTLQMLLYGAIGLTLARRWNAGLDYAQMVRLAAVAVTPVVVVRTLLWFGPWEPAWYLRWPAGLVIALGYLRFGIRAAGRDQAMTTSAASDVT